MPQRRCIVTGEVHERDALLRFVTAPDGVIVPDVDARLPGRGLWLTPRRDIVERAVAKRSFARAARQPVAVPADLPDRIEALLAKRCCDTLGLARRAGSAVAGHDRVGEAVRCGRAALLVFALDAADGVDRRLARGGREVPVARVLTADELGSAFGRERIVYAAVAGGNLCRRLRLDLSRLAGFRRMAAIDNGWNSTPAPPAATDGGKRANG